MSQTTTQVPRPVANSPLLAAVTEVEESTGPYTGILYGPMGTGKTSLAATAPKPLFMDIERGTKVLKVYKDERSKVGVLPWRDFATFERMSWEVRNGRVGDYQTFVLDSVTELQKKHIDEITASEYNRTNASGYQGTKRDNPYVPWQQDYKLSTEAIRRVCMVLRDSPINIIIIAHQYEEKDEDTGSLISIRPGITPSLAQSLVGMVDFVAHITAEAKDGKFVQRAQISPGRKVSAKNRIGAIGTIDNPTWDKFIGKGWTSAAS